MSADLKEAVEVMRRGGVILYPTDTVWGLGCDATNPEAVARIYEIKRRVESKSMLALVSNEAMLERYVEEVPEIAWQLIEAAVNPLTIIYDQARGLAPNLIGQDGSIGIRITGEKYSRELCQRLRKPVVSTSANISGEKAPAIFAEIADEIKESVDYIAAYRRDDTSKSAPSSIIKLGNDGVFKIIR
ncbi:MAG: threonylcarbamoyl-AMP synthase [Muribaculaceae bacterium]|nr:threonylcarbamoyl-AMP synthase [Bacteroidales bacterium]MDE6242836.1 threonylcarbamoyl-AMP synthase [Muribaculaceae bacterium]